MRKLLTILAVALVVLAAAGGILILGAYQASRHVPDFYEEVLVVDADRASEEADHLEREVFDLHNQAREEGNWEARFTDQQVNAWLAVDLPEKFPRALPRGVSDPRVAIDPQGAVVACRYQKGSLRSVLSLRVEVYLTDEPNVVAFRIRKARAGALPVPLARVLTTITRVAQKLELPLRWAQTDGDPVALVTVPDRHPALDGRLTLQQVQLSEGQIKVAGCTAPITIGSEPGDVAAE